MTPLGERKNQLTRRALIIGGVQLAGVSALAGRLYYLQFLKSDEFRTQSENNRIKLQLMVPERGHILDRNGEPFALNDKNYQLFLDTTGQPRGTAERLLKKAAGFIPIPEKRLRQVMDELRANPFASPLMVKEHLSWEEVAAVELHQLELPGMYIGVGQVRTYPLAEAAAHLTGYVGSVSPTEVEKHPEQPLLKLPDYKIGKSAVELLLEERLRGKAGLRQLEVNVHGQIMRELSTREAAPGENVRLTIDQRLQSYGAELLKEESAGAIVMDVTNGNIRALISVPGFDPNIFSKGIPQAYWDELHANIRDPLVNKAMQGQYPPGSTFKMLVGLAGLKKEEITPEWRVHCPGHFYLGDHRFNCWKEEGHGSMNLASAIAQSCDTYFYTVARNVGIEAIGDVCRMFGLGSLHLPGFLSEKHGLVPDPAWKQKRYKQRWTTGDTVNVGIGQGFVLATPIQLAVMAARLATGRAVVPRLTGDDMPVEFPLLEIGEEALAHVRKGMDMVTNSASGTAYGKRIQDPKYAMAGKTGTSQVKKILKRGMKQETLPWEDRHHALFIGYAPVMEPKFAVAVIVEHGGGGSATAAPIARDLLLKVQQLEDEI